ncbi:MAG: SUMF1/EgtB/PvdO family nonheme iron enzyme [Planctomycetes bacterium]|nr:SUMF1/EgtB/PvdO family nonheme iron enzyme [Planctomycetota bacterium]
MNRYIRSFIHVLLLAVLCGGASGGDPVPGDLKILCVKRVWPKTNQKAQAKAVLKNLGFPTNHECQSSLPRGNYKNEIGIVDTATGEYTTLYKPKGNRFVGHINLHWNADKLLFTQSGETNWKIFEINVDGTGLRQVSQTPDDVDCFESCYLPDGRIIFNSNAPFQCVPCWHGAEQKFVANLYIMNADGSGMRRLTFDQDHDYHPFVRHNGQVVYSRWDYTGINRVFLRPLMVMNPDGTGQRAIYGSNSWFPNGLYYPKELPGRSGMFLSVLGGYHGSFRSGMLVLVDINKGSQEAEGIIQRISGTGGALEVKYKDRLTEDIWPEFMTPTPISDEYFLTSAWKNPKHRKIGIYLADTSDNVTLVYGKYGFAFLEPIPLVKRKVPPVLPDRVNTERSDAIAFIQDIYTGPGLKDVPRGTVKRLRVIAYDFGYTGLAGMDKIGLTGPWEAMRILGTTPLEKDGSAIFRIPANTPVAFQPLDSEGKAVQLMRSWVTAMPGEIMSCIGCHESSGDVPDSSQTVASIKTPRMLEPWYGPARGFDFAREVQPVLNRYCVRCHDQDHKIDLRPQEQVPDYTGRIPGRLDLTRLHPVHKEEFGSRVRYTPAYETLLPYVRRVNVSDDVSLLEPGEYHADTSELIQHLKAGHKGIELDEESWSRLVTWIDLNGACHGTWNDVYDMPTPDRSDRRRLELAKLYGGPEINPAVIPAALKYDETPVKFKMPPKPETPVIKAAMPPPRLKYKTIDLGGGEKIKLVKFGQPYWMGACEISNAQFRKFDPAHTSRYYGKRHADRGDDKGLELDDPDQPAIRVSWNRAMAFCQWLSKETGLDITLPTEEQWETACLAGSAGPFHYRGKDFSRWENMADRTFATFGYTGKTLENYFQVGGDNDLIAAEGVDFADRRFDDKGCATMGIGSYRPNAFGLYDMHGNAAEWTRTDFGSGEKTVKGGSFLDRPARCGADIRHGYPPWQNVYNTGFRIVAGQ